MLLVLILFGKQGLRLLAFVVGVSSLRDEHCSVLKEHSYTETLPFFVLIAVRLPGLRGGDYHGPTLFSMQT